MKNFCLFIVVAFCATVGCDSQQSYIIRDKNDFDEVLALAEQGDIEAMNSVAAVYHEASYSEGIIPPNAVESLKWSRKAADLGSAEAQYWVGSASQDEAEGLEWYRKSAEQGYSHSQNWLGLTYQEGWGVTKNPIEAYAWHSTAKANGYVGGQGWMLEIYDFSPEEKIAAQKRASELFSKYPSKD
jgi:TPR repeat protein